MPSERRCSQCGAPLPENAPGNRCPKCLIQMALEEPEAEAGGGERPPMAEFGAARSGESAVPREDRVEEARKQGRAPAPVEVVVEQTGITIGRYKLLQQIGEGGFGVVFMAEQTEPVQRKVALKVIKAGMDSKEIIARFEAERQALALMDHPNIAKVFDAGTTGSPLPSDGRGVGGEGFSAGRPYFVMELVRGLPVTDYCDQANLSTRERLELFIKVCRAVQHAHQKGVIHRDLKPSNVLVTLHDGEAVPKVIDFGVAKALGQKLTEKTLFTRFEQMIGTPAYMSPEQAALSGLDIDTRSDIYSLGVLLYELLTGVTPLDADMLRQGALDEIRRMIQETDPPKPSTRLLTLGERLTEVARHRHAEPASLRRLIRGDLDWITMKALEKDRQRRYETVNGLAMDVERHLNCEPVVACPPSRFYEFQKTVRRHKFGFAAAVALVTVLTGGVLVSTWQAVRATRAERDQTRFRKEAQQARAKAEAGEQRAQTESAKNQQTAQFLKDMLRGVGPGVAVGRDTTLLRGVLDQTVERLGKDLTNQPAVQAELCATLGNVYLDLGEYTNAAAMHRQALDLRRRLYGHEHATVAQSLNDLAEVHYQEGKYGLAERLHAEALAMRRKLLGNEHLEVAESLNNLAEVLRRQKKYDAAEPLHREALSTRKKLLGDDHLEVASSLYNLGILLWRQERYPEAEAAHREALAIRRKLLGAEHPEVAISLDRLGLFLNTVGRNDEAERVHREALAMRRKLLGNEHPEVAHSLQNLSYVLIAAGRLQEAEPLLEEALAIRRKRLAPDHPDTKSTVGRLASVLRGQNKLPQLERLYREELMASKQHLRKGDPVMLNWLADLASVLREEGKFAEVEPVFVEALAIGTKPAETPGAGVESVRALHRLASVAHQMGQPQIANQTYRVALRVGEQAITASSNDARLFLMLGHTYRYLGGYSQSSNQYAPAREAFAAATKFFQASIQNGGGADKATCLEGEANDFQTIGDLWAAEGRTGEAHDAYRRSLDIHESIEEQGLAPRIVKVWVANHYVELEQLLAKVGTSEDALRIAAKLHPTNTQGSAAVVPALASCYFRLAELLLRAGKPEAERVLREGLEIFEKAATNFTADSLLKQQQAYSHRLLANLLGEFRRTDEAEQHYREAIKLYAGLAADEPQHAFHRQEEAYATWMLAALLEGAGRLDAAEAEYRRAITLHEKARENFPGEAVFTERSATVKLRLAELLRRRGRLAEAEEILGKVNSK